jgi:phosphatidate phosphatase APP1
LLVEFFRLKRIPLGPLFLRDFGARMLFASSRPHRTQKLLHIDRILGAYPDLPFVLIGDSGERDPEIYAEAVKRYPQRIRAIYIRSVDRRPERLAAIAALADTIRGTPTQFVLAQDSADAAAHAAGEGFIHTSALEAIRLKE